MSTLRNIPYVKAYDANGDLINPILFAYKNNGPNRKQRRSKPGRLINNKKGIQLVVVRTGPYSFSKFEKVLIKQGDTGTRVQVRERKSKR